jgi:hypothetical protein
LTKIAYPDALPAHYRLHWYVIERVLGQGGFGITYLARDTNLDQPVAIKEYLPVEIATRRPDATVSSRTEDQNERYRWGLERFIREARTLARFDHANIVRVHSVFEHNDTAYMVMRFEEGETLEALLARRRTLPENELVRILLPILDGLALVHDAGFIHRDIKPDNILIRADGTPVLLDFGSARHALGRARTVTILVAPGYAPFEQYYSSGESQGPWTDIYGLGATCYRAISGAAPIDAIARSKGILGSTREMLVPARNVGSGRYSERLLAAIDHALAFAEHDRPQSIAQWRKEITEGAHAAPSAAGTASPPSAAALPPAPARSLLGGARAPVVWAVLGALVAAGAVGAAFWLLPSEDQKRFEQALARIEAERRAQAEEREKELARRLLEETERKERERAAAQAREREAEEKAAALAKVEIKAAKKPAPKREPAPAPAPATTSVETALASPKPAPAPPPAAAAPKSDLEAFEHYQQLAHRGSADAALKLAELYEAGRGVSQSNNWACSWYALAERRGVAAAKAKREAVVKKLQPREVRQCDNWAAAQAGN